MNVCLIDADSKIPNLALMKASTWHKMRGDTVKLGYDPSTDHPDLCYISKVFDYTPEPKALPDCETFRGGPGYGDLSVRMPMDDGSGEYDRIMPDYELYYEKFPEIRYAMGRFTRGCPNGCPWCVVPKMDGRVVRHVADLKDFWCGQRVVRVLDDNIMADEDEFIRDCGQLYEAGVKVIWEALDIRFMTDRKAMALSAIKTEKSLHFAWDGHSQDKYIEPGIEMLKRSGTKPYKLMFYVLVGFNTTPEYDMHRILTLRKLGVNPFVMPYRHNGVLDPYCYHLSRWVNDKRTFKKVPLFDEYEPWAEYKKSLGGVDNIA